MVSLTQYFKESVEELRHVRWPTQKQAVRFSAVVLGFTIASAILFGFIDFGLSEILSILLNTII
jgi:preprotein translocase subunit SecE